MGGGESEREREGRLVVTCMYYTDQKRSWDSWYSHTPVCM